MAGSKRSQIKRKEGKERKQKVKEKGGKERREVGEKGKKTLPPAKSLELAAVRLPV